MLSKNQLGYIPLVLILSISLIGFLTVYAGTKTESFRQFYSQKKPKSLPIPNPSVSFIQITNSSKAPSPTPLPTLSSTSSSMLPKP